MIKKTTDESEVEVKGNIIIKDPNADEFDNLLGFDRGEWKPTLKWIRSIVGEYVELDGTEVEYNLMKLTKRISENITELTPTEAFFLGTVATRMMIDEGEEMVREKAKEMLDDLIDTMKDRYSKKGK